LINPLNGTFYEKIRKIKGFMFHAVSQTITPGTSGYVEGIDLFLFLLFLFISNPFIICIIFTVYGNISRRILPN
ncbi:hypothetical protein, partial [Parabacteroides sp. PF5-6]|uniref:hypothetical protein n=1 Tax=Parabacteroides sp. PF5-6 TaxID=1742403 RepID=UPI00240572A4